MVLSLLVLFVCVERSHLLARIILYEERRVRGLCRGTTRNNINAKVGIDLRKCDGDVFWC